MSRHIVLQRRENDEWSLENPTSIGLAAHALKEWLIDDGEWEGETKDELRGQLEDLRSRMENDPDVIADIIADIIADMVAK